MVLRERCSFVASRLPCRKMDTNFEESVVFQQDLFSQGFLAMDEIRRLGKFCDVTLKVDSQSFSAHRVVLAANIPYFHAMFSLDMVEQTQRSITIKGIEANALEAMINFAYSGRITIDINNVQSFMMGASFLQLPKVREACSDFLKTRLHSSNVLGIRSFAVTFDCDTLVDASEKYIQKNFCDVSASEEYLLLSQSELLDIVKQDELCVVSEEEVFEAVMRWVKYNPEERQRGLPQLLSNVRMPLLTPRYLADHVATEELIRSSPECRDLLDEARDYHLLPERRPQLQSGRSRPRNTMAGHIFAIGEVPQSDGSTVEVYDPMEDRWQQVKDMNMSRIRMGVAVLRNRLYAFAGWNGKEILPIVEVFDPQERIWSQKSSMLCERRSFPAAALNDRLYVCGGSDGHNTLNSVECYLPDKDEWTIVASMNEHRNLAGVVAFEGYIYALGGSKGRSTFSSVERYDPCAGQWQEAVPMLTRRHLLGAATLNGKIYVCGGSDGPTTLRSVEVFDPATNEWKYVAPMNVKRMRLGLVANMGKLWAIGGFGDRLSELSSVEMYEPNTDSWTLVASMCGIKGKVAAAVVPMCS